jgi:hypothetical protein
VGEQFLCLKVTTDQAHILDKQNSPCGVLMAMGSWKALQMVKRFESGPKKRSQAERPHK